MRKKNELDSLMQEFKKAESQTIPVIKPDWNDLRIRLAQVEVSQDRLETSPDFTWKLLPFCAAFSCLCLYFNWVWEDQLAMQLASALSSYPQFLGLIMGVG